MTTRETHIAKKILNALHELDGGQVHALSIHAEIGGLAFCTGAEFDSTLELLDSRRFVLGVNTRFMGRMWSISDAGEAARLQM